MRKHVPRSRKFWRTVPIASLLALGFAGCSTPGGLAGGDLPPCPESVLVEALVADSACLTSEALADLVTYCEAIDRLRRR